MNADVQVDRIELIKKWIQALRSGEYSQTQRRLRDSHGYCCLGVLCDLYSNNNWIFINDDKEYVYGFNSYYYTSILPAELELLLYPNSNDSDFIGVLMGMNDNDKSFSEIADYIENWLSNNPPASVAERPGERSEP